MTVVSARIRGTANFRPLEQQVCHLNIEFLTAIGTDVMESTADLPQSRRIRVQIINTPNRVLSLHKGTKIGRIKNLSNRQHATQNTASICKVQADSRKAEACNVKLNSFLAKGTTILQTECRKKRIQKPKRYATKVEVRR